MTDQVTAQSPFFAFCSKFDIRPLPSSTSLRFISRRGSKKRPKPKRPSSVSHKKPAAAHPSTHREIVHRLLIPATLPPAHQVHFEMLDAVQSKPSRTDGANPINRMTHSVFFSFSLSFPTVISLGMTRNLPADAIPFLSTYNPKTYREKKLAGCENQFKTNEIARHVSWKKEKEKANRTGGGRA